MNQARHHTARPGTCVHGTFAHDLGIDTGHFVHYVFKLDIRPQGALFFQQAQDGLVVQNPFSVAQGAHHQAGVQLAGRHNGLFDVFMHRCLFGRNKACTHVDALSAQRQRRHQRAAIGHAARRDKRNFELFCRAGQQNEVGHIVFARVATALKPIHADGVATDGLGFERMPHRGAFVDHLDARLMQGRQPLLRVVACGFHHFHTTVNDGFDVAGVIGCFDNGQKGQVDAKRLVRHLAATANFVSQIGRRALRQAGDDAQAPGIGHGGGQLGKAHKMHASLNNGVLNSKHFGYFGFHVQVS